MRPRIDSRNTRKCKIPHYFTGQEFDGEVGLYYYNARHYDPELGRFLQADTYVQDPEHSQSLNRHSYTWNNPVNNIDPTGYFTLSGFFKELGDNIKEGVEAFIGDPIGTITSPITGLGEFVGNTAYDIGNRPGDYANDVKGNIENVAQDIIEKSQTSEGQDELAADVATGAAIIGLLKKIPLKLGNKNGGTSLKNNRGEVGFGKGKGNKNQYKTSREALREAKAANDIPRSAQPNKTVRPNTPDGDKLDLDNRNIKLYEYTNNRGETIHIRQDRPASYGQGGRGDQGPHFNAGKKSASKLRQHFYYQN